MSKEFGTESFLIQSEIGEIQGGVFAPDAEGQKPAVLMVGWPDDRAVRDMNDLVKSEHLVMFFGPAPTPPGTEGLKSPYLGPYNLLSLRAMLTGKTILGMRVDDTIRAVDLLVSRADVDPNSIEVYGSGAMGPVVLHAAALDSRIKKVVVENTLASYRMVIDQPLHRDISEIVVPGVLTKYDMGDLIAAISPRPVTVVNPLDATGATISPAEFNKEAFGKEIGLGKNIRLMERGPADPVPLD